jgi:hypothetical protein
MENYVTLRRSYPTEHVAIPHFANLWAVGLLYPELKALGFDFQMVMGMLDGVHRCIDGLSLQIMNLLIERTEREARGESHLQRWKKAITDQLVDYLIFMMMDRLAEHHLSPPQAFIMLVRERLGGSKPQLHEKYRISETKTRAAQLAARMRMEGERGSMRQVAQRMGVASTTVSREWFRDKKEFEELVALCREAIEDGVNWEKLGFPKDGG